MTSNNYTVSEKKIGNLYSNVDTAYMNMRVALTTFVTKFPKADRDVIYDILLKGNFATANAAINTFKKKGNDIQFYTNYLVVQIIEHIFTP